MENCKITFIGSGNMTRSLIGGLIANHFDKNRFTSADPNSKQRQSITDQFGITTFENNNDAVKEADVVVLAVKPQRMYEVATSIANTIRDKNKLIISIAAGVKLMALKQWLGDNTSIVRIMPNTPALVRSGTAALFSNDNVSDNQKNIAEVMMRSVGTTVWLENEEQMDAVTALSGSGPAYFLYVMEAMEKGAVKMGLNKEEARLLTVETALGTAKMVSLSGLDPAMLRKQVTSPGGVTEQAVNVFKTARLDQLIIKAMKAAEKHSKKLSQFSG